MSENDKSNLKWKVVYLNMIYDLISSVKNPENYEPSVISVLIKSWTILDALNYDTVDKLKVIYDSAVSNFESTPDLYNKLVDMPLSSPAVEFFTVLDDVLNDIFGSYSILQRENHLFRTLANYLPVDLIPNYTMSPRDFVILVTERIPHYFFQNIQLDYDDLPLPIGQGAAFDANFQTSLDKRKVLLTSELGKYVELKDVSGGKSILFKLELTNLVIFDIPLLMNQPATSLHISNVRLKVMEYLYLTVTFEMVTYITKGPIMIFLAALLIHLSSFSNDTVPSAGFEMSFVQDILFILLSWKKMNDGSSPPPPLPVTSNAAREFSEANKISRSLSATYGSLRFSESKSARDIDLVWKEFESLLPTLLDYSKIEFNQTPFSQHVDDFLTRLTVRFTTLLSGESPPPISSGSTIEKGRLLEPRVRKLSSKKPVDNDFMEEEEEVATPLPVEPKLLAKKPSPTSQKKRSLPSSAPRPPQKAAPSPSIPPTEDTVERRGANALLQLESDLFQARVAMNRGGADMNALLSAIDAKIEAYNRLGPQTPLQSEAIRELFFEGDFYQEGALDFLAPRYVNPQLADLVVSNWNMMDSNYRQLTAMLGGDSAAVDSKLAELSQMIMESLAQHTADSDSKNAEIKKLWEDIRADMGRTQQLEDSMEMFEDSQSRLEDEYERLVDRLNRFDRDVEARVLNTLMGELEGQLNQLNVRESGFKNQVVQEVRGIRQDMNQHLALTVEEQKRLDSILTTANEYEAKLRRENVVVSERVTELQTTLAKLREDLEEVKRQNSESDAPRTRSAPLDAKAKSKRSELMDDISKKMLKSLESGKGAASEKAKEELADNVRKLIDEQFKKAEGDLTQIMESEIERVRRKATDVNAKNRELSTSIELLGSRMEGEAGDAKTDNGVAAALDGALADIKNERGLIRSAFLKHLAFLRGLQAKRFECLSTRIGKASLEVTGALADLPNLGTREGDEMDELVCANPYPEAPGVVPCSSRSSIAEWASLVRPPSGTRLLCCEKHFRELQARVKMDAFVWSVADGIYNVTI